MSGPLAGLPNEEHRAHGLFLQWIAAGALSHLVPSDVSRRTAFKWLARYRAEEESFGSWSLDVLTLKR